jgi:glucose-1-phosphate thymidylyltransferase
MKGIILAGGSGTRLYPMTRVLSKQLQPIYDKPMIFYPLSIMMLARIRDILIISTERDTPHIENLLGNGSQYGIKLSYQVQKEPKGLAEAFILGEEHIKGDNVTMILGDNLFYGDLNFYREAIENQQKKSFPYKAQVFGYFVEDPSSYGVVEFDRDKNKVLSIEEKPTHPKSHYALPGLYIFDETVSEKAKNQKPSPRGELEITDLMKSYLKDNQLGVQIIGRGVTWLDTGTPESLLEASNLIRSVEKHQGLKVAALEEIALRMGFFSHTEFINCLENIPNCPYKNYLKQVAQEFF